MQVSGKASVAFGKALRKIIFTFCNLLEARDQIKEKRIKCILKKKMIPRGVRLLLGVQKRKVWSKP